MLNLFVVTGISGSGKTSALNMLEDLGYYCIDNLPVALIKNALSMLSANGYHRIALSVDARDKESSKSLIPTIDSLTEPVRYKWDLFNRINYGFTEKIF